MKTAILVDGAFFLKRYHHIKGFSKTDAPELVAQNICKYCFKHIHRINLYRERYKLPHTEMYRIYYYDAKPFEGDSLNQISKKTVNFRNSDQFKYRNAIFSELKKQRKVALRLGFLKNSSKEWVIKSFNTKKLLNGTKTIDKLKPSDLEYPLKQKAVDMKIGIDIATLAYKEQVTQIILITGDSDFVPAAKFARKEGIDFILDPMMNNIDPTLYEHIDGLITIKTMTSSKRT